MSDGSHPNVLLIGGYGSNTLTGGTAEFGNFVPGNFIDRAKSAIRRHQRFRRPGPGLHR